MPAEIEAALLYALGELVVGNYVCINEQLPLPPGKAVLCPSCAPQLYQRLSSHLLLNTQYCEVFLLGPAAAFWVSLLRWRGRVVGQHHFGASVEQLQLLTLGYLFGCQTAPLNAAN